MSKKIGTVLFLICLFTSPFLVRAIHADADNLIIQDNGRVVLLITNTSGVLAAAIKAPEKQKSAPSQQTNQSTQNQNKPQQSPSSNPAPVKSVPIVPAHTESTIQMNPPINNDRKIQVIITTKTALPNKTQQPSLIPGNNKHTITPTISSSTNTPDSQPTNVITKTVDQVIAQGSNGKPVITIKSDNAYQLTIQQGDTKATTVQPLQIDSITHSLSIPSSNQSAIINVLPAEALQGILNKGFLDTQSAHQATINLTKDATGIDYTVQSQKKGKAFGIFTVSLPIQVKVSAQNGRIINTPQSLFLNFVNQFVK